MSMNAIEQVINKPLVLSDKKIDVFLIDFTQYESEELIQYLSHDECQRADRLKVKQKREQFVITRSFLRRLLANSLTKDHQEISFSYGEHGKPFIYDMYHDLPVEFNISHSGQYGLMAITLKNKVGVDIEETKRDLDYQALAKRFFSKQEIDELEVLDKEQQYAAFYCIWARKEAFIKASGEGVAYGLDQFSVSSVEGDNGMEIKVYKPTGKKWFNYNLMTIENYATALVTTEQVSKIIIHK